MEVLVDRHVRLVVELKGIIQETGAPSLDEAMELALRKSSSWNQQERHKAIRKEVMRYRAEVEDRAFEVLRQRKEAASRRPGAMRKEPVTFNRGDDDYFSEILEGLEPHLSEVADAPGVTSLSLNISWNPRHPLWEGCSASSFISSCHKTLLVLCVGNCRPGNSERGFYLVYNTRANSVAIVPPLPSPVSHYCDIAGGLGGAAVLCLSTTTNKRHDRDDYLLAELLLRIDSQSHRPTNKATLFMWEAELGSQWLQREVELPLPSPAADQDYSFCADMVFPVGSTVLCWADLLSGALLYKHGSKQQTCFHFIPLPDGYAAENPSEIREQMCPQEFRSMCCVNEETLKFVSMDQEGTLITVWAANKSQWHKEASFRIRDLSWDDTANIKDELKLPALGFAVFSTLQKQPGADVVIYLSLTDYECNNNDHQSEAVLEATRLYVLGIDMHRRRVLSVFKVPPRRNGTIPHHRLFATRIEFDGHLN